METLRQNDWQSRWSEGRIGFHLSEINPLLRQHAALLGPLQNARVLVPLCGKSLDMLWLAEQGAQVVGVELIDKAVQEFVAENNLQADTSERGSFTVYQSGPFELYVGNMLDLAEDSRFDAIYDRAAMIAMEPSLRQRYADILLKQLKPGGHMLLLGLDYDSENMSGPPFALSPADVSEHFAAAKVEWIAEQDALASNPRFAASGLTWLNEYVIHIQAHA